MDPSNLLPIRPTSPTLTSHLSALDSTISNLEGLPTQTRWPTHIPLTSRARVAGQIIHPNEVKVDLGQGWWVDMTAPEAAAYLRRRKMALLEAQAMSMGGGISTSRASGSSTGRPRQGAAVLPPPIHLNPVFMGLQSTKSAEGSESAAPEAQMSTQETASSTKSRSDIQPSTASSSASDPRQAPPSGPPISSEPESLEDVLDLFLANEKRLSEGSRPDDGEPMVNEDGLPIHEIRETPNGEIIGPAPEATQSEDQLQALLSEGDVSNAWDSSAEAEARRRELRLRVLGGDDDDLDEDTEDDEEEEVPRSTVTPSVEGVTRSSSSSTTPAAPPNCAEAISGPSTSTSTSKSTSTSTIPPSPGPPAPRSILKPPPTQVRKKSVSFDPTVPLPPDSPEPSASSSSKHGFQLPLATSELEGVYGQRAVPVIPAPIPGRKASAGFGGMKRGFLDPPSSAKGKEKAAEPVQAAGRKKPSLFAQRMAQSIVRESPTPDADPRAPASSTSAPTTVTPARQPAFPAMAKSATSATNTLRSAVVEKPSPALSAQASSSKSTIRMPAHDQRPVNAQNGRGAVSVVHNGDDDHGDEDQEDEDDDDFYNDDDDEESDEYNLDDALLAREVALEYHRRRAYASPYITQDPDDPNYGLYPSDPTDAGGVLLAMPQIDNSGGGAPRIVNPTPDDFRRFVKVGKLENGNLVLAPGEEGWSDDQDEEDEEGVGEMELERRRKRDNRRKMAQALMGNGAVAESEEVEVVSREKGTIGTAIPTAAATGAKTTKADSQARDRVEDLGLPPVVGAAPRKAVTAGVGGVRERTGEQEGQASVVQPKKVSRFKAARMGAS